MADEPQNLILEHLRAIRGQIDILTLKTGEIASTQSAMLQILANQGTRMDRMEDDIKLIKTRIGLIDA